MKHDWQPMILIGIAGQKRSGKTTLANYLAETKGMLNTSFAEPIRKFVAEEILHCTLDELEREKETPIAWLGGITPREIMQRIGTELGREMIHPEIWVRIALRKVLAAGSAVLSDVRFANEAIAIREQGGVVIRVNRAYASAADRHVSEIPLPPDLVDFEIENNGGFEALYAAADRCLAGAYARATCLRRE